jgi:acyl-CoA synthetase (AMP-forming)/AMP-acid ligase II/pimeloyl-ACP methyl ester carboxylesterase
VLDSWAGRASDEQPELTLLCVHGNPTWSYLWRRLLAAAPAGWRVIAPDQLGMGYSDRIGRTRVLAERIEDLGLLTAAMAVTGPVVTVAHDWGGIISLGWAQRHRTQLAGVVLTNTAVHLPVAARGPILIRLAHVRWLNRLACRLTPLFVRTTTSLTWPRLPKPVRAAFALPYRTRARRAAVADFVLDIPFAPGHPSHGAVDSIASAVPAMDVPALLMWGPRDPVFGEIFLRDLQERFPQAVLHRYENASHLLPEDAPGYAAGVIDWVGQLPPRNIEPAAVKGSPPAIEPAGSGVSALAELDAHSDDRGSAVDEVGGASITWKELHARVAAIGAGMAAAGIGAGTRVALLVPPSIELTVALYSVWRAGGVIVVADRGLGVRGMGRALRSARIDYLIGDHLGLLAALAMRLPGNRIAVRDLPASIMARTGVALSLPGLARSGAGLATPPDAEPDDEAAVLFTSGATGPAKGVLYRQRQVRAQLELVTRVYGLTPADRLVAAFAPFALFGPALGIRSAVPDVDVTQPGTLTAKALADAALAVDATVIFASPAALRNVLATAADLTAQHHAALGRIRLVASFGAPIPVHLLRDLGRLIPTSSLHTPYGMTEAFPLTDISLPQIESAGEGDGVCVGLPLTGVELRIAPLRQKGTPSADLVATPHVSGEVWATAPHIRDRYDTLWLQNRAAAAHPGWHRTGDVGFLDDRGQLWIQGRLEHVISTAEGPVTPVGIEQRVEAQLKRQSPQDDRAVATVGVGPAGIQQVVVVVTGAGGPLAPEGLTDLVRTCAGARVAAVLVTKALPLDIRHNSKIDRTSVAAWAGRVLAGR